MGQPLVLVTGATGFLGRHLVKSLVQAGYTVRAFVRDTSAVQPLIGQAEVVRGSLDDINSLVRAATGCKYVVHTAAFFRFWGKQSAFENTNVHGTSNMLMAARRQNVERFIHISTLAVVGKHANDTLIDETTPCHPMDAYQRSKYDGENTVRMFSQATGLRSIILRPGAFYGPGGHYAFNRLFFEDPLRGLPIKVHQGHRYTFPVYVPDVAQAVVAALTQGRPGELYNVSGASLPHTEVNNTVSRLAHISPLRLNIPEKLMLAVAHRLTDRADQTGREPYYPINLAGYVFQDWRVSSEKAKAELGFTPTPFADGARQTLEWYWATGHFKRPR